MSEPGKQRCRIVSEHSNVHTARVLLEQIETLPKGSLLTVFNSGPGGGIEDPSIRMQVRILRPDAGCAQNIGQISCYFRMWKLCWASAILLDTAMDVLKRPDEADDADEIPTRPDDDDLMDVDEDPRCAPWLDSRCPESLMPNARTPYASILVEPECVERDPETDEAVLVVCRPCSRDIMTKRVPALSIGTLHHSPTVMYPLPLEIRCKEIWDASALICCHQPVPCIYIPSSPFVVPLTETSLIANSLQRESATRVEHA
ncbi:hypothetical protein DFH09DRAFT_1079284 [Mycena vulgaris]|nr:hypothetical protein DFH09DRAFT_1079284 [Mycena vulgaris]